MTRQRQAFRGLHRRLGPRLLAAGVLGMSLACAGLSGSAFEEVTYEADLQCSSGTQLNPVRLGPGGPQEEWGAPEIAEQLRWGRRTTVRLRSRVSGRSVRQAIDEVLHEEETPGRVFRMRSCSHSDIGPDRRSLSDSKPFRCASARACAKLDRWMSNGKGYDLVFRHGNDVDGPLELLEVTAPSCALEIDCELFEDCCRSGDGEPSCMPEGTCDGTVER